MHADSGSSHVLLIVLGGVFSIYFYVLNRLHDRGLKVIEGVVGDDRWF